MLIRLVDSTARTETLTDAEYYAEQAAISATITEGTIHENVAKEGDIYVKADGTTVVLAYGENGILGEGQGVAPDLGLVSTSGNVLVSGSSYYSSTNTTTDSFGNSLNNQVYKVNPITGSGHWFMELNVLLEATKPTSDGTFDCQLSSDQNWYWDGYVNTWVSCFNVSSSSFVAEILSANGL